MDQVSVAPGRAAGGWQLAPGYGPLVQGLLASGFSHLPASEALFLRQAEPGNVWLDTLDRVAPIADGTGKASRASALAFSRTGLTALGLDNTVLATFDLPFREGMHAPERSRRLGDADPRMVAAGGVRWSGGSQNPPANAKTHVHALLLLYGRDHASTRAWADTVLAALAPQIQCEHRLALDLHQDARGLSREHFGFTDGLSQPVPYGEAITSKDGRPIGKDRWHGMASGDLLLGHLNAHGEPAPGPYVARDDAAEAAGLVAGQAPPGFLDLGLNGSYLVVRELHQDVAAFWQSLDRGAAAIRRLHHSMHHVTAEWLAERIIGRDRDGNLLCPAGTLAPDPTGQPQNAVGFFETDPFGDGCPIGSHVRRANPRDTLAGNKVFREASLAAANGHRIVRRGRKFGPPAPGLRASDGQERGLLFMCLNTDIARQFEFVQQTWLLNPHFASLGAQADPLIGPGGPFTLQHHPLSQTVDLETFVRFAGGEYFFLPSLPALHYLRCHRRISGAGTGPT